MKLRNKLEIRNSTQLTLSLKQKVAIGAGTALMSVVLMMALWPTQIEGRLAGYSWRIPVMVDTAMVHIGSDLFDFPVYIELENPDLKTEKNGGKLKHPDGYDLRFTAMDGATPLLYKISNYNPSTGKLAAWVSLDTFKRENINGFYLYYGATIPVETQEVLLGNRQIKGHYFLGGNTKTAKKSNEYPKEWLFLETANQTTPHTFLVYGETEDVEAPLPMNFQYFKAGMRGGQSMIVEWATYFEHNNDFFVLERSLDAKTYAPITKMGGGDDSKYTLWYSFSDPKPVNGLAYYRLRQANNNGKYTYSDPISVSVNKNDKGIEIKEITPKPFWDTFTVTFTSGQACITTLQFFDESGNLMLEEKLKTIAGENEYVYQDKDKKLSNGTYVFTLMGYDKKLKVAQLTRENLELSLLENF